MKRYDKPTNENMGRKDSRGSSGESGEREPMSEKKGQPSGSGEARGIGARGVDMCMGEAPSLKSYDHMPESESSEFRNDYGIGEGDGGPSIDKMGPSNPGQPL